MSVSRTDQEKNFISSLISGLANRSDPPTHADVENTAKQLAGIFGYTGNLTNIVEETLIAIDTRMGAGVSLIDNEADHDDERSEEHTSELQSLMRISYAVFCLKKKNK